ncbi:MAG TPA: hypothetical protein VGO91_07545 [Pyrinomonadaceae bacterium]|jgi:hypothetical protein|nr:hypothetical protein [Pyrinomonadaceae bacterium]
MEKTELLTIQLRLEGIRHAITRARFTLLISVIASIAILVTVWNAYLSDVSHFATQHYWSEDPKFTRSSQEQRREEIACATIAGENDIKTATPVTDYVQQQIVAEWIKNQVISISLLGIRVSAGDLAVIGSISLFIISIWLFSSMRRENRAVGTLILYANKFQDWNLKYMVYQGIAHYLVLIDFRHGDKPISDFEHADDEEIYHVPFIRGMVKLLFLLPSIAILFVITMDVWTLFRKASPFRPSAVRVWDALEPSDAYWLVGYDGLALCLFVLTTLYCVKMLKFANATGKILDTFRRQLLVEWKTQNAGNNVLDEPQYEQKKSKKQQILAGLKRRYFIVALLCACIFIASTTSLLIIYYKSPTPRSVGGVFNLASDVPILVSVLTAIVSAVGTISTIILAWRNDRRDVREKEVKIAQLEQELAAIRETSALPIPEENRK